MEHFEDQEFFNAIASSLETAQQDFDEFAEHFDDAPEQEDLGDFLMNHNLGDEEPLTPEEKEDILHGIRRLPPQYLKGMWNVVTGLRQTTTEEEEQSPTLMLRQLDSYLKRRTNIVFQEEQPGQQDDDE